jgi:putative transposase
MKKHGAPKVIVTDRLKSYRAAMKITGNESTQKVGR